MRRCACVVVLAGVCAPLSGVRGDTVVLQPNHDNTLYEDIAGGLSNGHGDYIFTGLTLMNFKRRALLSFDVAGSVPQGAVITSATVTLTMSRGGSSPIPISLQRVTRAWGEGLSDAENEEGIGAPIQAPDAGWLHAMYPSTRWTTPGGDFLEAASSIATVSGLGTYTWPSTPTLAADVAEMLATPSSNFGWLVLGDEFSSPPTAKRFNSRENPDPGSRPMLTITYTVPAPGAGAGIAMLVGVGARRRRR